ncbi:MAG: hypothetical protein HY237_14510, partial [Acidobacteria bacterium]|nr:hypothetical protein [Acidobacteriota bacterium]
STAWRLGGVTHRRRIEFVYTYRSTLLLSLEVATFQREKAFEPAESAGHFWVTVEAVVIPGQLALLLLALRRRFRR